MSWRNRGGYNNRKKTEEVEEDNGGDDQVKIELGKNKFVTVSKFKGKVNVQIREYYEKDGKVLPTKKGIALSVEQWEELKTLMPDIDVEAGFSDDNCT